MIKLAFKHFKKRLAYAMACLFTLGFLAGCSIDDRYQYTFSYRIENQTTLSLSGNLILDSTIYSDPQLKFEIEPNEIIELLTTDGGDGPNITPPVRQEIRTEELQLITNDSIIEIAVDSENQWIYTTERSNGVYTFLITSDVIN